MNGKPADAGLIASEGKDEGDGHMHRQIRYVAVSSLGAERDSERRMAG
jgi:hypothetical protein